MDGVSLTMQNYAFWLHKKTQNVCVVTPKNPEAEDCTGYPVFRYSSAPIPMRKPYRLGFPGIDWPFQLKLSRLSFELAHAHCPFSSGKLAVQVARSQNIPLIATFHSKYRTDIERIISNKYLVDLLIKKIVRFYEMADEVWIPQASVEETLREYGYKGKVEVVNNGSDLTLDASSALLRIETAAGWVFVKENRCFYLLGSTFGRKIYGFILDSLALIRDLPFQMFFVGSGYAYQEMVDRVAERNLSHKIHFLGNVADRNVLKSYYTAADLFLFPSLYDNAPLVVREAAGLHTLRCCCGMLLVPMKLWIITTVF
jgi:glycosyltransferase involved in cell wall biosynthesis